jgi:hypothetical protein
VVIIHTLRNLSQADVNLLNTRSRNPHYWKRQPTSWHQFSKSQVNQVW